MQIRIIINHIPSVIGMLHLYGTDKNIIFQTKRFDPYCHLSRKVKKDMVLVKSPGVTGKSERAGQIL